MTTVYYRRPSAREAGSDLLALAKWEETAGWLVEHTAKWPKSARFSLVQKVDNHALDVLEMLVVARYEPGLRRKLLRQINLRLERLRFLLRVARARSVMPASGFETAMRGIDELGRMVHGWRVAIGDRAATEPGAANAARAEEAAEPENATEVMTEPVA